MAGRPLVFIAALLTAAAFSAPQRAVSHPGTIVNADTGAALEADAAAYRVKTVSKGTADCPAYDTQLSRDRSRPSDGHFTLQITANIADYVAVYCRSGYAYRVEESNRNDRALRPRPVTLLPLAAPGKVEGPAMKGAIDRLIDLAARELRYFSEADRDAFASAMTERSADDHTIVELLLKRARSTQGP
jgi:hypothetical protein